MSRLRLGWVPLAITALALQGCMTLASVTAKTAVGVAASAVGVAAAIGGGVVSAAIP